MESSSRRSLTVLVLTLVALAVMPAATQAASLHVVFPQTAEVTVVQGSTSNFSIDVQAFGATACDATTAPVRVETLYSVDAVGDIASGLPADMPITTDQTRGVSDNCDIKSPVVVPLTATAAIDTPVGDYTGVIRYGKGGDGDIDLDGPVLTIHVVAAEVQEPEVLPTPELAPPEVIVLGERVAPKPKLGKSVMLTLVKGTVTYVVPGAPAATLAGSVVVPNGTKVDASKGVVKVTVVRDATGALDSADAWAGAFTAAQGVERSGRGLTTLTLANSLKPKKGASAARASRVARKNKLWVNGKGNFKTRGKRASAIVRGTYWYTEETEKATKVSVKRGLVAVRDFVNRKTVLVSQGHSYTAQLRKAVVHRVPAFTGSVRH
jgi:hypothetical protein